MIYLPSFSEILAVSQSRGEGSAAPHLWDGLVGAWSFQEGGGGTVFDVSHGHDAAQAQADQKTKWTAGQYGRALEFDGTDDNADAGVNVFDLGLRRHGAISAWYKAFGSNSTNDFVSDWGSVDGGLTLRHRSSGSLEFYIYPNNHRIATASGVADNNVWNHLVGVMDGATMRLYLNGVEVGSETLGEDVGNSVETLKFGSRGDSGIFFDGLLADVRIYNRSLSDDEIKSLYSDPWAAYRLRRRVFAVPASSGTTDAVLPARRLLSNRLAFPPDNPHSRRSLAQPDPAAAAGGGVPPRLLSDVVQDRPRIDPHNRRTAPPNTASQFGRGVRQSRRSETAPQQRPPVEPTSKRGRPSRQAPGVAGHVPPQRKSNVVPHRPPVDPTTRRGQPARKAPDVPGGVPPKRQSDLRPHRIPLDPTPRRSRALPDPPAAVAGSVPQRRQTDQRVTVAIEALYPYIRLRILPPGLPPSDGHRVRNLATVFNAHPFRNQGESLYATIGDRVRYRNLRIVGGKRRGRTGWIKGAGGNHNLAAESVSKTARVDWAASPTGSITFDLPASFAGQTVTFDVRRFDSHVENETDNSRTVTVDLDANRDDATGILGTATLLETQLRAAGVVRIRFVWNAHPLGVQPAQFRLARTAGPTSPDDVVQTYDDERIVEIDTAQLSDSAEYTFEVVAENGATTKDVLRLTFTPDATGPPAPTNAAVKLV